MLRRKLEVTTLIDPSAFSAGQKQHFWFSVRCLAAPPAAATPSPAQRGISRQQKDKQDEELHQPRLLACLFIYFLSHAAGSH